MKTCLTYCDSWRSQRSNTGKYMPKPKIKIWNIGLRTSHANPWKYTVSKSLPKWQMEWRGMSCEEGEWWGCELRWKWVTCRERVRVEVLQKLVKHNQKWQSWTDKSKWHQMTRCHVAWFEPRAPDWQKGMTHLICETHGTLVVHKADQVGHTGILVWAKPAPGWWKPIGL